MDCLPGNRRLPVTTLSPLQACVRVWRRSKAHAATGISGYPTKLAPVRLSLSLSPLFLFLTSSYWREKERRSLLLLFSALKGTLVPFPLLLLHANRLRRWFLVAFPMMVLCSPTLLSSLIFFEFPPSHVSHLSTSFVIGCLFSVSARVYLHLSDLSRRSSHFFSSFHHGSF